VTVATQRDKLFSPNITHLMTFDESDMLTLFFRLPTSSRNWDISNSTVTDTVPLQL
jgi:hypothetical protein